MPVPVWAHGHVDSGKGASGASLVLRVSVCVMVQAIVAIKLVTRSMLGIRSAMRSDKIGCSVIGPLNIVFVSVSVTVMGVVIGDCRLYGDGMGQSQFF